MIRRTITLVTLLLTAVPLAAAEPAGFFVHPGDRVLFLGDSITEQYQYSTYIELYLTTRFPRGDMTFLNAGIGGDTATGGARRFASHVLAEKPTAVTIDFGMNDGGYKGFNPQAAANYARQPADGPHHPGRPQGPGPGERRAARRRLPVGRHQGLQGGFGERRLRRDRLRPHRRGPAPAGAEGLGRPAALRGPAQGPEPLRP